MSFEEWKKECSAIAGSKLGYNILAKDDPYDLVGVMRDACQKGQPALDFIYEVFEEDFAVIACQEHLIKKYLEDSKKSEE